MTTTRIRQIALIGDDYDRISDDISEVFGLAEAFRDPGHRPMHEGGVSGFGLRNVVWPIGDQFLELVAPAPGLPESAGRRYLDRRGGPGGYMVLFQVARSDYQPTLDRATAAGIRLAETEGIGDETSEAVHFHPKDLPGAIVEVRWCDNDDRPDGDWWPVERDWREARRTDVVTGIAAVEIQTPTPAELARTWAAVLDVAVGVDGGIHPCLRVAGTAIRFVQPTDGRPEGLGGLDLVCVDPARARSTARRLGLPVRGDVITVCGTRMRLVKPGSGS
ncbi:MAG: VOC family protein [Acidimicrobiales bacterium]